MPWVCNLILGHFWGHTVFIRLSNILCVNFEYAYGYEIIMCSYRPPTIDKFFHKTHIDRHIYLCSADVCKTVQSKQGCLGSRIWVKWCFDHLRLNKFKITFCGYGARKKLLGCAVTQCFHLNIAVTNHLQQNRDVIWQCLAAYFNIFLKSIIDMCLNLCL